MRGAVLVLLLAGSAWAQSQAVEAPVDDAPLPKLKDLKVPTTEELLAGKPVDWIVLLNQDVIFVEPVKPRPETLTTLKAEYEEISKIPTTRIPLEEKLQKLAELQRLHVTLPGDGTDPEYTIETRFIDKIVYFEDLILQRVAMLLDDGELRPAFELLMYVDRRHRNWPGFDEHYHRFLFLEAGHLLAAGRLEQALVEAEHLLQIKPDYSDLSQRLGKIVDRLIRESVDNEDFRRARHFLARLQSRKADHPVVSDWTRTLSDMARATVAEARVAQQQGDHRQAALLVDRAARVWPSLSGLKDAHRELIDRHQILRVGVVAETSGSGAYPFTNPTEERRRRLCEVRLFEEDHVQDGVVRYRSRVIESWEPRDLGRRIHFRMRPRRADWESRPVITAGQIVDAIAARTDPEQPEFDPRWHRDVSAVSAASPMEWQLTLTRIPLRVEPRLRIDLPLSPDMFAWSKDLEPAAVDAPHQQRFYRAAVTDDHVAFRRTRPQPAGSEARRIAEVVEHTFPTWEHSLQALLRGDVDLLPVAEARDVPALTSDSRFLVLPYALPRTHVILVHPDSILAANASLRRALLHALDRDQLLKTVVLPPNQANLGRLVTGPFATKLAAYDPQLRQPDHDPIRAASLVATARRQLDGELPELRLAIPSDPAIARIAPELIAAWKHVGLDVRLLGPAEEGPWDLAYRSLCLTEPVEDLWSLLHPDGSTAWQQLSIYPHWIRERLWELEQTVDWSTAQRLLQQIQAEFLIEARWLPLWELDERAVVRRRINGLPSAPMHTYHDIERWTLQSWYPTETP